LDGHEKFHDFTPVLGGDFSVWCDAVQCFMKIGEGVVVKVGNYYVWFEPCILSSNDEFREVIGEFELIFDHILDLKLKVISQ
jgi:hypothetical protein